MVGVIVVGTAVALLLKLSNKSKAVESLTYSIAYIKFVGTPKTTAGWVIYLGKCLILGLPIKVGLIVTNNTTEKLKFAFFIGKILYGNAVLAEFNTLTGTSVSVIKNIEINQGDTIIPVQVKISSTKAIKLLIEGNIGNGSIKTPIIMKGTISVSGIIIPVDYQADLG